MRRLIRWGAVIAVGLCLLSTVASAEALQEKTFVYNGARWPSSNTEVATFWEAPTLTAGESYTGGSLTLENASPEAVTLTLTKLGLPQDNEEQMAYLSALQLQILQGDTVVYRGAYAALLEGDAPVLQVELQPEDSRVYTVSLSCPFSYTGEPGTYPVVSWTFDSTVEPVKADAGDTDDAGLNWPLSAQHTVALICAVAAVVFLTVAVGLLVRLVKHK